MWLPLPTVCRHLPRWPHDGAASPRRGGAITIGLSMSVLSNSMTNLALPYIAQDLDISAESSIWIVNAYQIALMICCCRWRRWPTSWATATSIASGLALFSLASIGCALAPSLLLADRSRAPVQGLGGAAIMSVQPALVRSIYPRATSLGRGLGFNTTVVATSLAAGPSASALLCSPSRAGRSSLPFTSRSVSSPSSSPPVSCRVTTHVQVGRST